MSAVIDVGIRCPECRFGDNDVTDSRPAYYWIRRRRRCRSCGHRWTTAEVPYEMVQGVADASKIFSIARHQLQKGLDAMDKVVSTGRLTNPGDED